jgi:uncharacterized protein
MKLRTLIGTIVLFTGALSISAQKELSIAAIQGDGDSSPFVGEQVRVKGIVTAVIKRGFFVQTPDEAADKDPRTSDAIYVYGPDSVSGVTVGNSVDVVGTVAEFSPPKDESWVFRITQITRPTVRVISKSVPLPTPVRLTNADLDPKGKLAQMERFEGMRVTADVVVVAPTGGYTNEKTGKAVSNGVFFVTIQGTPRPFREPGIDLVTAARNKMPATTQYFDMNPELLRVNSQEQTGAKPLDVPAGATIKSLTGVIDYYKKFYSLLVDASAPPVVENVKPFVPVSPGGEREVTVAAFNIHNFFDDEVNSSNVDKEVTLPRDVFHARLNKVSLAIRNVLASPDIIGIVEVENLKVLQKIADRVNADAAASGRTNTKYTAYLEEGNDFRGIDVGFLVNAAKVRVVDSKQLAKDIALDAPGGSGSEKLFDRPPLMLRAEITDVKSNSTFALTVVVNHFKSYLGVDSEKDGERVRTKRRLEAEWLANFVADRQKADPAENIILCGDFNAFQFHDGYNDLMGILKGKPEPNVLTPSKAVVTTGLVNLIDYIEPKNRYSYTYDGSAQALDHILINKPLRSRLLKFGYARLDADFPLVYANDATRPERISDHDAPVVFLSLDDKPAAKPATSTDRP